MQLIYVLRTYINCNYTLKMLSFKKALQIAIEDNNKPIISPFEIFCLAKKIDEDGDYKGQHIRKQRVDFSYSKVYKLIRELYNSRFLSNDSDFGHYFRVADRGIEKNDEVCCLVDPFCYVSHLSAMQKYGLTNRISEILILTTAENKLWNQMKMDLTKKYLGNELKNLEYIPITKATFPKAVRKMPVKVIKSKFLHPSIQIKDSYARISEIGYTFLDMIDKPDLCGGIQHVIDIWKEHAKIYLDEIIQAVDSYPKKITKSRAGYIIDEVLNIKNDKVNEWLKFSQRGGSRLLDPSSPFVPKFSEKWMISINV